MDLYWTGILGGLIGSLITVAVTKYLEILLNKKQHNYNLQKIFFERKLETAEMSMKHLNIVYSALMSLSVLYLRIASDQSGEFEEMIQAELGNHALKFIEKANESIYELSFSLPLYFDIESILNNQSSLSRFADLVGDLDQLIKKDNEMYHLYLSSKGIPNEKVAFDNYLRANAMLKSGLLSISSNLGSINREIERIMKLLRLEMKKFEL